MISTVMFDRRWLESRELMCRTLAFPRGPVRGTLVNPACISHLQECRWNEGQVTPSLCVIEAREDGNWQTGKVFSRCLQHGSVAKQSTNRQTHELDALLRDWETAVSTTASVSSMTWEQNVIIVWTTISHSTTIGISTSSINFPYPYL